MFFSSVCDWSNLYFIYGYIFSHLQFEAWKEAANVYLQLEEAFDTTNQRLSVSREDSLLLHCLMRDLSSLTQAMGRMYPHFIGMCSICELFIYNNLACLK